MKNRKRLIGAGISALAAVSVLACTLPMNTLAASESAAGTAAAVYAAASASDDIPASGATLTFTDGGVTASGETGGCKIEGTSLSITESGVYTVTGSCSDGSITVKKGVTGVTLILSNLELSSSSGAVLSANKESEVTVYLAGTSILTDAEDPADETSADTAVADAYDGAAIKAKANSGLTITGEGTLTVNGNAKNGIKGGDDAAIVIEGGTLNVNAANDAINANGDLTVTGGTLNITAADDALHADGTLTIGAEGSAAGPVINVLSSSEGLEGARVILNSGTGTIRSSDDGVNAASDATNDVSITVNGGEWIVNADGDGLDAGGESNRGSGSIVLNGGTVVVYGSANNGNGALDSESGIIYNGGTLIAIGMSGMAEAPAGGSVLVFGGMGGGMGGMFGGQPGRQSGQMPDMGGMPGGMTGGFGGRMGGMMDGMNGRQDPQTQQSGRNRQSEQMPQQGQNQQGGSVQITEGSTIVIADSAGNALYEATGVKNADSVIVAGSAITEGETYTLTVDGRTAATAVAGQTAGMGGGTMGGMSGGMPGMDGGRIGGFGGRTHEMGGMGPMPGQNGGAFPAQEPNGIGN